MSVWFGGGLVFEEYAKQPLRWRRTAAFPDVSDLSPVWVWLVYRDDFAIAWMPRMGMAYFYAKTDGNPNDG